MMRYGTNPIIILINNGGYTIEVGARVTPAFHRLAPRAAGGLLGRLLRMPALGARHGSGPQTMRHTAVMASAHGCWRPPTAHSHRCLLALARWRSTTAPTT
jgi:hypothetical protein